jgi:lysophospholipase L1-like esterase
MLLSENTKLVMVGDSITDCERQRPVGEGFPGALGNGYVNLAASLLDAVYPEKNIRIINMGVNGNTVKDLKARWLTDVLELSPDWVCVMIGINDVWRHFGSQYNKDRAISGQEYRDTLEKLVSSSLPYVKGLVLMSPYLIEPNADEPMRALMDSFGFIVMETAKKYGAVFVDTQAAFNSLLRYCHPVSLSFDRIHPNLTGHMLLARAFLNGIGFQW